MEAISEAMEELVAAVRELALSMSSVKVTVDPSMLQARATLHRRFGWAVLVPRWSSAPVPRSVAWRLWIRPCARLIHRPRQPDGMRSDACQQRSTRSAHPWEVPSVNDLEANCVGDSSDLTTAVPTTCSMLCSITHKDGVQAEATSIKPSIASTTVPVPAGLLMFPFVQQCDALLPHNSAPVASLL